MPTAATKQEFCRRLFRAGGATPASRASFLDTLADAALEAQTEGKTLTQTASGGQSASFMVFSAFAPADVLALIAEARTWAAASTIAAALEMIAARTTVVRPDFSQLGSYGAL